MSSQPAVRPVQPIGPAVAATPEPSATPSPVDPVGPRPASLPSVEKDPAALAAHRATLTQYCGDCHGGETGEGGFVLSALTADFADRENLAAWNEVLNVVGGGEMPPEGNAPIPVADSTPVLEWIERSRLAAELANRRPSTGFRRLNRTEYAATVRDLFGVALDVQSLLPPDGSRGGFDNNAEALVLSPLHVESYLKAGREVADAVCREPEGQSIDWRFEVEQAGTGSPRWVDRDGRRVGLSRSGTAARDGYVALQTQPLNHGEYLNIGPFELPEPGRYRVRVHVAGVRPDEASTRQAAVAASERHFAEWLDTQPGDRRAEHMQRHRNEARQAETHFRRDPRYRFGSPRLKIVAKTGGHAVPVALEDVDPGPATTRQFAVSLEAGQSVVQITQPYHLPAHLHNRPILRRDDFPRPQLLVDWVEIVGPVAAAGDATAGDATADDTTSSDTTLGDATADQAAATLVAADPIGPQLQTLLPRLFRRPVSAEERQPYVDFFERSVAAGTPRPEAASAMLAAALCSPKFLFVQTPNDSPGEVDPFGLAERLAYFLWSGPPDDRLQERAAAGELTDSTVLAGEVDRMLADPRAGRLVASFVDQWLDLRTLGLNPPVADRFPRYDDHLEASMIGEARASVAYVLSEDRPIGELLDADYVVINERLARYYEIDQADGRPVRGDAFRRVDLPPGHDRGGLLTQAGMLTLTSNGTRTSPVKRGVWILQRILGTPPSPPPPSVEGLRGPTDVSRLTLRERLEVHRDDPNCARCHRKIDPLGFPLERFDAAGRMREREGSGPFSHEWPWDPEVVATSEMVDGTAVDGSAELRRYLATRRELFRRSLVRHLATYACSREIGYADEPAIDVIVRRAEANGDTLRAIIQAIVASELFRPRATLSTAMRAPGG